MSESTAAEIAKEQRRRHAHNTSQSQCRNCGSFVSKGQPSNGQLRYQCNACGRAILEYVSPAAKGRS